MTAGAAVTLALGAHGLVPSPATSPTPSIDDLVAAGVLGVGAVAAALLAVGSLTLLVAHALRSLGRTARILELLAHGLTPVVLRRVVAAGLGAGIGLAGPLGVAGADEPDLGWTPTAIVSVDDAAGGMDVEADPTPGHDPSVVTAGSSSSAAPRTGMPTARRAEPVASAGRATSTPRPGTADAVTVRPGDSLWSIAAEHLGTHAAEQVAQEWPRWYEANRATIGEEPDLIRPGQVLHAPAETGDQR